MSPTGYRRSVGTWCEYICSQRRDTFRDQVLSTVLITSIAGVMVGVETRSQNDVHGQLHTLGTLKSGSRAIVRYLQKNAMFTESGIGRIFE